MPLTVCHAHDIVYDDDRYDDGCPICNMGAEMVVLEKRIEGWENTEDERFKEGQQDMARILRNRIAINRITGHSDKFILDEIEQLIKKGE